MEAILKVHALQKVYADGTIALMDIHFEIPKGEFVAVIGPSGAGKSTLLRCINRLVMPTSGSVIFRDQDVVKAGRRQVRQVRREMGMVFQGFNLVQRVTVLKNVLHGRLGYMGDFRGAAGAFSKQDVEKALNILERVGLKEQAYKRADELSGGQMQRVGIARALSQEPALILADEPIASLDPATSETIMGYLKGICTEDGITCLVNLHQVDIARKYATRIIGIHSGRVVFDGAPEQLTEPVIQKIYYAS